MRRLIGIASAITLVATFGLVQVVDGGAGGWSGAERQRIASLSLTALPALPPDPSNAVADDPAAAALGKALFFDTRLSADGKVACATCHDPAKGFQDGTAVGHGVGVGSRRTMPVAGTAYSPWMFWDGRADNQWAQALGPLENPLEHGSNRGAVVALVTAHYADKYAAVFGNPPDAVPVDRAFANVGKVIAAFERTILPAPTRFDAYADAISRGEASDSLNAQEVAGRGCSSARARASIAITGRCSPTTVSTISAYPARSIAVASMGQQKLRRTRSTAWAPTATRRPTSAWISPS